MAHKKNRLVTRANAAAKVRPFSPRVPYRSSFKIAP